MDRIKEVIIFTEKNDLPTDKVINWLSFYNVKFKRINCDDFLNISKFRNLKINLFDSEDYSFNVPFSVWFRRVVTLSHYFSKKSFEITTDFNNYWATYNSIINEYTNLKNSLFNSFEMSADVVLGNYRHYFINKLIVLQLANKINIDVPATIVTNNKDDLTKFLRQYKNIITKPIDHSPNILKEKKVVTSYTEKLTKEILQNLPDSFFPSLFQENLDKEIEIRTFFLAGECYSTAIFSQLDQQTSTDYRRYNISRGNRHVPFKLPPDYENKIIKLMKKLSLNTGSIDTVKTKNGRYVFLEVNPVGQYGKGSEACNYYLHKRIACYLAGLN